MKKLWILGICACLMGMTACDGDDKNDDNGTTKGAIGASCSEAADCESNYCSDRGKCAEAPAEHGDIVCEDKDDGEKCGEGKECKAGACVDKEGGDPQTECETETDCPNSHTYECIEGACVLKGGADPCEGKEDGTECGEGKECKAGACVNKEGGEQSDLCKDKEDGTECGEGKECKAGACVNKEGGSDPTDYAPCKKAGDKCGANHVCDADLKCIDERCSADKDPCKGTEKPHCHIITDQVVCSAVEDCGTGSEMGIDGLCTSTSTIGGEGSPCNDSSECAEGLACYEHICSSGAVTANYRYVRIEDMSAKCDPKSCGEDPGADIDAIVLVKAGKHDNLKYAAKVIAYNRSDNAPAKMMDNSSALDPMKALGAPDAFVHYPTPDQCNYFEASVPGDDKAKRQYTFVSLGGKGGYLDVDFESTIEAGDIIDVLELGSCTLFNTQNKPNESSNQKATAEEIQISISTTGKDGAWKLVGTNKGDPANQGILSFSITSAIIQ